MPAGCLSLALWCLPQPLMELAGIVGLATLAYKNLLYKEDRDKAVAQLRSLAAEVRGPLPWRRGAQCRACLLRVRWWGCLHQGHSARLHGTNPNP